MADGTTRAQIVEAADDLFYRQGYEHTSFADIAGAVRISRGNFYYHFKTKDEILDAVIAQRLARTAAMLAEWEDELSAPADRIRRFIDIVVANQAEIMRYGCPVGTLCGELAKLDHGARDGANRLVALFRDWLQRQFAALGPAREADARALHVLVWSQGVATLANVYRDKRFIRQQVGEIRDWLAACAPSPKPS